MLPCRPLPCSSPPRSSSPAAPRVEIRTHHDASGELIAVDADNPSQGCSASSSTTDARAHSIEDYKDYWAGYVEFDDEGWLYGSVAISASW